MKLLVLFIFIFSFSQLSFSMVNMRNASYNETWVDYIDPGAGIEIKIQRYYSSRSLFIGMFGYGWCSKLETHLTITSDGILNLTECGGGLEVTYYPNDFDSKSRDFTIGKIIEDMKTQKQLTASDIVNVKTQLRLNTKMRFEYAKQLGLIDDKKIKQPGTTFFSKEKGFEQIYFDGKVYVRKLFNGVKETYDKAGRLIKIDEPTKQYLAIKYKGQLISHITDGKRSLSFIYKLGRIFKISNGSGLEVQYKFMGDNLIEVTNMWKKTYNFEYDPAHNMVGVNFPDNTKIRMTYDLSNDWIKSYTNRKDCREEFEFSGVKENSKSDPKNHYIGKFTRSCKGNATVHRGQHEFWYTPYVNAKGKYLKRVLEEYRSNTKDVEFHPYFGRPVKITENKVNYRGFSYYENGFVNVRDDILYKALNNRIDQILDWTRAKFDYDRKTFRVDEVVLKQLNDKGKVTKSRKLKLDYNNLGLLTRAREGKGQFLKIEYDKSGNVRQLTNETGDTITLTHKPGIEKPVEIKLNKVGAVKIAYDEQGEIESLDSEGKRNIATSIIEKFLSMIAFLGPMGEDLEI